MWWLGVPYLQAFVSANPHLTSQMELCSDQSYNHFLLCFFNDFKFRLADLLKAGTAEAEEPQRQRFSCPRKIILKARDLIETRKLKDIARLK